MSTTTQSLRLPVAAGPELPHGRYFLVALMTLLYCGIASLTRAVLAARTLAAGQIDALDLPRVLLLGVGYDAITCLYLTAALSLYLLLVPRRIYRRPLHRVFMWATLALTSFGLIYLGAVEYFFFDEFSSRFNFVAVEYLIYPHEVFVNIWQSYPVAKALAGALVATAVALYPLRRRIDLALASEQAIGARAVPAAMLAAALVVAHLTVNIETGRTNRNRVADELAGNGIYTFFNAATNSHLDYPSFYVTLDEPVAVERARRQVKQSNATFLPQAPSPLARHVGYAGTPKPLHVIVVLEESLGAEFLGAYGDRRGLTPNLDRLADRSLVFTRTYATGTRTVRGIEGVTASFPPVPAESIVKRPRNEGMFNWSTVMREQGYQPTFVYGGYGAFDNMNYFFKNNGYRVHDRSGIASARFSNIWGASDEDLFEYALKGYDAQQARGEKIFSVVLTTSNHKPFTFPAGIEGVKPSGGGREAGVRYADYALGRFIEALGKRPWADDALVVIVGDHGARVYGREEIPVASYEVPFIVYSPRHVAPRRVHTLTSQLDVAPTVLGLLNISYDSVFFGRDALLDADRAPHALLNHNRDVALYRDGVVSELGFRKSTASMRYDPATRHQAPAARDEEALKDAASLFQLAYTLYSNRTYRTQ
jgi:phosphoglycerol transferase MdoB-like AlkP superfamily enzyme